MLLSTLRHTVAFNVQPDAPDSNDSEMANDRGPCSRAGSSLASHQLYVSSSFFVCLLPSCIDYKSFSFFIFSNTEEPATEAALTALQRLAFSGRALLVLVRARRQDVTASEAGLDQCARAGSARRRRRLPQQRRRLPQQQQRLRRGAGRRVECPDSPSGTHFSAQHLRPRGCG
jgi:hypothetical protein